MSGHASAHNRGQWRHDPGLRLFLIAIAIVVVVFVIAFMLMTESVAGGVATVLAAVAPL